MAKSIILLLLTALLIGGCTAISAPRVTPTAEVLPTAMIAPSHTASASIPNTSGVTPGPTNVPSHTDSPTPSLTGTLPVMAHPAIYEMQGDLYETLFRIPVGPGGSIQYYYGPSAIEGPHAIASLPDQSFLIADPISGRLLRYDPEGLLLGTLELSEMGIGYIRDMRVRGGEIFLLETSYQKFRIHRLSLSGDLIASEEIPYTYPVDAGNKDFTLENSLSGIAIDCEGNVLLEVWGGSKLFPLVEIQRQPELATLTNGYRCNGILYQVNNPEPGGTPQLITGSTVYETSLTIGLGGLSIVDVFSDGGLYIERSDVMNGTPIQIDLTVHFIGAGGVVIGGARVPLSEYYYSIHRKLAIGMDGEVYALLPRPDALDVIRLNFYSALEPLVAGAEVPVITIQGNAP